MAKKQHIQVANVFDFVDEDPIVSYDENNEESFIEYLQKCDRQYYIEGQEPLIDDSEYDRLRDLAQSRWPTNEYFSNDNIGISVSGNKVTHDYILGSLTKYKVDTVVDWLSRLDQEAEIYILPKFDGLSIYAEYENGKLTHAATRGDGTEGADITEKIRIFAPEISTKTNIKLRGEILLPGNKFEELGMSNRRNAASGIIGRKEYSIDLHHLKIIFYEVIEPELELKKSIDILNTINYNLETPGLWTIPIMKVETLKKYPEHLIELLHEIQADYSQYCDLDGLVLIYDSDKFPYVRENVYRPKNKCAFKHNSATAEAIIQGIEWKVSRNGRCVPVCLFSKPYPHLDGAEIRRATGFNAKFILTNKIISGTKVEIQRSGAVIPHILRVI